MACTLVLGSLLATRVTHEPAPARPPRIRSRRSTRSAERARAAGPTT